MNTHHSPRNSQRDPAGLPDPVREFRYRMKERLGLLIGAERASEAENRLAFEEAAAACPEALEGKP